MGKSRVGRAFALKQQKVRKQDRGAGVVSLHVRTSWSGAQSSRSLPVGSRTETSTQLATPPISLQLLVQLLPDRQIDLMETSNDSWIEGAACPTRALKCKPSALIWSRLAQRRNARSFSEGECQGQRASLVKVHTWCKYK